MTRSAFDYVDGVLHVEGVSAVSLAEQFGTPLYVYSRAALTEAMERLRRCLRRPSRDACTSP